MALLEPDVLHTKMGQSKSGLITSSKVVRLPGWSHSKVPLNWTKGPTALQSIFSFTVNYVLPEASIGPPLDHI